jgi:hypothetical protein
MLHSAREPNSNVQTSLMMAVCGQNKCQQRKQENVWGSPHCHLNIKRKAAEIRLKYNNKLILIS